MDFLSFSTLIFALGCFSKSVLSQQDSCLCGLNLDIQCGTDGVTYPNACRRRCAGAEFAFKGDCAEGQPITAVARRKRRCTRYLIYQPVCGVDGITYDSWDDLECQGAQYAYWGKCREPLTIAVVSGRRRPCPVYLNIDPVCGKDGKTYDNESLMRCRNVELAHYGKCRTTSVVSGRRRRCPDYLMYDPVCGVDGTTYDSPRQLNCNGVKMAHYGRCADPEQTSVISARTGKKCPRYLIYDPVCGVDGKTYGSYYDLRCDGIGMAHYGKCKETTLGRLAIMTRGLCYGGTGAVCGTDGVTYPSDCDRSRAHTRLAYFGPCTGPIIEGRACFLIIAPVCGMDGVTYPDDCARSRARTQRAYFGECKPCTKIYRPECGMDGVTYPNACVRDHADIHLSYMGACVDKDPLLIDTEPFER